MLINILRFLMLLSLINFVAQASDTITFNPKHFLDISNQIGVPDSCQTLAKDEESFVVPSDWYADSMTMTLRFSQSNPTAKKSFVFLGGGPGENLESIKSYMTPLISKLPAEINLILMDHRGTGCSQKLENNQPIPFQYLSMFQAVEDLRAYLDHIGQQKIYIYGGSYGSFLALAFARKYPQYVELLFLDSVFGDSYGISESNMQAIKHVTELISPHSIDNLSQFYNIDTRTLFSYLANNAMNDNFEKSNLLLEIKAMTDTSRELIRSKFNEPFGKVFKSYSQRLYYGLACQEIWAPNLSGGAQDFYYDLNEICPTLLASNNLSNQPFNLLTLPQTNTPTLIFSGEEDIATANQSALRVFASLPNASMLTVNKTGHAIIDKETSLALEAISTFIQENGELSLESKQKLQQFLKNGKTIKISTKN